MKNSIIEVIREKMIEQKIDYYFIDTFDPHGSEYINDYYKIRDYVSGFTGSNGYLLIGLKDAYLWTDGRYFVQAEKELYNGITLMKMGEKNVLSLTEFLQKNLSNKMTIAFDGTNVSTDRALSISNVVNKKKAKIIWNIDLIDGLWKDRPLDNANQIWLLDDKYSGEKAIKKINKVKKYIKENNIKSLFINKLDEIMWLFNIRGNDIECNPVAYSFCFITPKEIYLFVKKEALTNEVIGYFESLNINISDYNNIMSELGLILINNNIDMVQTDFRYLPFSFYKTLESSGQIFNKASIIELLKAVKNKTEIKNIKNCYINDSVKLTQFIKFLKENKNMKLSELDLAEKLDSMRSEIPDFIGLSFPTISAYGSNAAMMHYEATPENFSYIKPEGLYLVDSGGQYLTGTTDVTRTVVLGPISEECKKHYTLSVVSMLRLLNTVFIKGTTGRNLDIIAREPMWSNGLDYKCGTGHGIGYILNVHEGPQNISYHKRNVYEQELIPGMITSDEPGVYIEGEYGIRIENILLVKKVNETKDGIFYGFESLTYVPIDMDGIDVKYMNDEDITYLNNYNKSIYNKISPFLNSEEKNWLKNNTYVI